MSRPCLSARRTRVSEILYDYTHLRGVVSRVEPMAFQARAEIVRGLSRRVHGIFASRKNQASLPWRTREEHDLFRLLEVDPSVLGYEAMPERITFLDDGHQRHHVPAARVITRRGEAVVDAFRDCAADGRRRLIAALEAAYADRGVPYRAYSGKELRVQPRMANARHILAHRCLEVAPATELAITAVVSAQEGLTLAELADELPYADGFACVMAVDGTLVLDLSADEPKAMRVSLARGAFA